MAFEARQLGFTDLELATIGLGTWAIGGGGWEFGWGPQEEADSIATIHHALDGGINWIDTAAVYGLGRSESVIGKALQGRRDEVILATKCGMEWDDQGNVRRNSRPERLRQEIDDSLRRLQTDVIDLYQIHWPDLDTPLAESWAVLTEFVEQGKVRYLGVSNFDLGQMQQIQDIHPIASLQPPYSLLQRDIEQDILPFCQQHEIGVIVYSPMESGLLTGAFTRDRLRAGDWRQNDERFQDPQLSQALAFVEKLRPIADARGHSVAHLAVAWTLRRPEVTAAIVGARNLSQAEQLVGSAGYWLTDDEIAAIDDAYASVYGA